MFNLHDDILAHVLSFLVNHIHIKPNLLQIHSSIVRNLVSSSRGDVMGLVASFVCKKWNRIITEMYASARLKKCGGGYQAVQLAALQGYMSVLKWAHDQWLVPLQDEITFGMAGACKNISVLEWLVDSCGHEVEWEKWAWHGAVLSHDIQMMTWIYEQFTNHTTYPPPTDFDWKSIVSIANLSFSVEVVEWVYEKCPKEYWQAPKFMPLEDTKRDNVVFGRRYPITSVLSGLAMYGDMDVLKKMAGSRLASEDCTSAILRGALVGGHGDILEWIRVAAIPGRRPTNTSPDQYIQEYIRSEQPIHPAAIKWLWENGDKVGVTVMTLVDQLVREGDLDALKRPEICISKSLYHFTFFSTALSLGNMEVLEWLEKEAPGSAKAFCLGNLYNNKSKEAKVTVDEARWVVKHGSFRYEEVRLVIEHKEINVLRWLVHKYGKEIFSRESMWTVMKIEGRGKEFYIKWLEENGGTQLKKRHRNS